MFKRFALLFVGVLWLVGCTAVPIAPASTPATDDVEAAPTAASIEETTPTTATTTAETTTETAVTGETRIVTHAMGETEVPANPQRVVVLDLGELDAALALGIKPVGAVTQFDDGIFPSYLEGQTDGIEVVGTIGAPNLEKIVELQPDLILSNVSRDEANYPLLSEIAPTILAARLGAVWKDNFFLYAEALGKQAEAEAVIAAYDQQIADLRNQLGQDPSELEVSMVRFVNEGIIRAYHRGSFIGSILDDVGFARPATQQEPDTSWTPVPMELLTDLDGDVIFYAIYGDPAETSLSAVLESPLWAQLTAVQEDRVYEVNGDYWYSGLGMQAATRVIEDLATYLAE